MKKIFFILSLFASMYSYGQNIHTTPGNPLGQQQTTDPPTGANSSVPQLLHQPVKYATTGALPANTYNNGTSGVGATITGNANGALPSQDGQSVTVNDRMLVKNEATAANNGIYIISQVGDASHPFILTRGNYSSISGNLIAGAHVFVQTGTANGGVMFYQITAGAITIGTTSLSFAVQSGSGGGNISKNRDSVMQNGVFKFRDSVQWGQYKDTPALATASAKRYDANSVIMLPGGRLMAAFTAFGSNAGDNDTAVIVTTFSDDQGHSWGPIDTAVVKAQLGSYIPSLYLRKDSTVIMLFLRQPDAQTGAIYKTTIAYPYTSGTWTAPASVYQVASTYYSPAGDRILKTKSGSLLYPVPYATTSDHGSAAGNYYTKILKSVDDGTTWSPMSYQIASPDSLCVESGLFQISDQSNNLAGNVYCYWRSRTGIVFMAQSTDTANSFGAFFYTDLFAPNSMTSIKYIEKYKSLIAVHNKYDPYPGFDVINGTGGRYALQYSVSPNGGITWERRNILDSLGSYYMFEPSILYDSISKEIIISYSRSLISQARCDFLVKTLPEYHAIVGDVSIQNDMVISPQFHRSYTGMDYYNHQGLYFLQMYHKGFPNTAYLRFSQVGTLTDSSFAPLIMGHTNIINNSAFTFQADNATGTIAPAFTITGQTAGGVVANTNQLLAVTNNFVAAAGFFVYGNGEIDVAAHDASQYLYIYNSTLGKTAGFVNFASTTSGNGSYSPWIHTKTGGGVNFGISWDINHQSSSASAQGFWITVNNGASAPNAASSVFRVDGGNSGLTVTQGNILQLLADGHFAINKYNPVPTFYIGTVNQTVANQGGTGFRLSMGVSKFGDNSTSNNTVPLVTINALTPDSIFNAIAGTATYTYLATLHVPTPVPTTGTGTLVVTNLISAFYDDGIVIANAGSTTNLTKLTTNSSGNYLVQPSNHVLEFHYDPSNYASFTESSNSTLTIQPQAGGYLNFKTTAIANIGSPSNSFLYGFGNVATHGGSDFGIGFTRDGASFYNGSAVIDSINNWTFPAKVTLANGDLTLGSAGNKIVITEGTNGRVGQTTLVAGTKSITITGLTTSSRAFVALVTPSGTTLTTTYQGVCTSNTLTIQANVAAGTINTSDASVVNYIIYN